MFSEFELKLLKGSVLTTIETLKCIPLKSQDIKDKIKQLENLSKKFD